MKNIIIVLFSLFLACCNDKKEPVYTSLIGKWKLDTDGIIWLNGNESSNTGHVSITLNIIADPNYKSSDTLYVTNPFVTYAGTTSMSMGSQNWKILKVNGLYNIDFQANNALAGNSNQFKSCSSDNKFTTLTTNPATPFTFTNGSWVAVGGYEGSPVTNKVIEFKQTVNFTRVN